MPKCEDCKHSFHLYQMIAVKEPSGHVLRLCKTCKLKRGRIA